MSPEPEKRSPRDIIASNRVAVLFGAIALLSLATVCILAILLIGPSEEDGGDGGIGSGGTPTPFATAALLPDEPTRESALVLGISDTETISVTVDAPASMNLAGEQFLVWPDFVSTTGIWEPNFGGDNSAAWVYGSIVNYIIGVQDTPARRASVGELVPGDEIILTTRNGADYTFRFSSREFVSSADSSVFAQNIPGLTIILLGGEDGERLVINGHYMVPETTGTEQGPVVQMGETAQLEDLQITVTGASHILDRPEAPPGFAFYLVDYQIQNVGLSALDTTILQFLLLDDLGNQYALSPAAVRLGNYPNIPGVLNSNQLAQASAGYQIPIGLDTSNMNWVVSRSDTRGQAQVAIPFGGGRFAADQQTNVSLGRAEVSTDLTSLILGGQVMNLGEKTVLISESDVTLRTDDGSVYLLLSTNPPFPWAVGASHTLQFLVTFQRPLTADTAVFTVLNQPYELTGLR